MALVQKSNRKTVIILLSVLAGVTVIGLLVYYLVIAPPDIDPNSTPSGGEVIQRDLPIYTSFGEDLFADPRYRALVPYGDLPVELGEVGRSNPFERPLP